MNKTALVLIILLSSVWLSGQELGEIVCPAPGDTVPNGQLLIVFRVDPGISFKPSSLDVIIDRTSYKYLMKLNGNKISVLVTAPMEKGVKSIRIKAKNEANEKLEKKWGFIISDSAGQTTENKTISIRAALKTSSLFSDVSGPGAALRQEPPSTHQLRFTGNIRKGKIEIPMKLYLSNHESHSLQPRDRFFIGIQSKKAGVFFGDVHPSYHKIIMNGTRIRGIETFLQFSSIRLSLLYGSVNRPVEGLRLYYESLDDPSYPPVNLQDVNYDSLQIALTGYYNNNGTYKRNLMAAKITAGSSNTNNKVHLVILRSTDDTNSIQYGGAAGQNLTFGIDIETKSKNKRLKIYSGIAAAFSTRDIHYGVASSETIEQLYGVEMPIDPYKFRKILVINTTTTLPDFTYSSFLSYYINPIYRIANQRISAEIRRIGTGFESFGNPYLINDRFLVSFTDRMLFLKNRLFISLRYKYFKNNLSRNNLITQKTEMVDAQANYLIKENLPHLNAGYRVYFRNGINKETKEKDLEYRISNYLAGILYNLNLKEMTSSLTLNYNLNQREPQNNQQTVSSHSIYTNLNQDYSFGLILQLQYNYILLTNDTSQFGKNNSYGIRFGYHTKNNRIRVTVGANRFNSIETDFYPASERNMLRLSFDYEIFKNFILKIEGGTSEYMESKDAMRNYQELWGQIGFRYRFVK